MKKIILLSTCALLLAGCDLSFGDKSTTQTTNSVSSLETKHNYDEVSGKAIKWNQIFSMPEDFYYVYFYSLTCSHCNELKDTIIPFALETTKTIYFCEESTEFNYKQDTSSSIGATSCDQFVIAGFPSLAILQNHQVVVNNVGVTSIKKTLNL